MPNQITILNTQISTFENLYSLNDLHKVSGSDKNYQPSFFLRNTQTKELIAELDRSANLQIAQKENNLQISGSVKTFKGGKLQGTYACKELVIAYAMWISPKFHLIVLRAFLDMYQHQQPQLPNPYINETQKAKIMEAVNQRHHRTGESYQAIYRQIHNAFGTNTYHEIKVSDFDDVLKFITEGKRSNTKPNIDTIPTYKAEHNQLPPTTVINNQFMIPNAGRWLVVVDDFGRVSRCQQLRDESLVNAESYRKLRQDMLATENLLKELRCRMTMVEGQASLSRLDTPILQANI